jgi:hypothetical protein
MTRSHYVILAMGLITVLVLSLTMQHLLGVAEERKKSPVGAELVTRFGHQLDGEAVVTFEPSARGVRAIVAIQPVLGTSLQQVSREVGEYVWHRIGEEKQLAEVDVVCKPWSRGGPIHFDVPRPLAPTAKTRRPAARPTVGTKPVEGAAPTPATTETPAKESEPDAAVRAGAPPRPDSPPPPSRTPR